MLGPTSFRATAVVTVTIPTSTKLRDDIFGGATGCNGHDTRCGATRAIEATSTHNFIDSMLRWIDGAWETVAAVTLTDDLDSKSWLLIAKGRSRLKVNGVPSELDERLSTVDGVPAQHIWSPIALRLLDCTPNAAFFRRHARRVHIETRRDVSRGLL